MPIEIKAVSGMEQLERWIGIHNVVRPDDPDSVDSKALIRAHEAGRVDLLAYIDREPVGAATLADLEGDRDAWIRVEVLPGSRGRGVGTALLDEVVTLARGRGEIAVRCDSRLDDDYSRGFLDRRGFLETGRWDELVLELTGPELDPPPPPEGVELTSLADRPDLLPGM
jgi:GNAT superfamily N-acetyltransferase